MTLEPFRMPPILRAVLTLAGALGLAACSKPTDASAENFTAAMNTYLAQRGDLCLGKSQWPIDVTEREIESGARNAVQMPVLEKLGLVAASVAEIDLKDDDGISHHMKVRRYALTDAGHKFYRVRDTVQADGRKAPQGNFCAARLSLDKVLRWNAAPGAHQMVVTYTYKAEPASWMQDADAQKVFPVVANVVRGAGSAELTETFRLTDAGWVAADL
ncbi:hypothetical protein [Variovorax sp. PBL-E5]|uniref:hypothetical protein n=1 Tax=Variovorax sp. PBL-E5 TaxID=434014 RepID=UPI0013183BAA|nr:hypothetical protein [Variovorax sp. PBL-E5]VTU40264.1 hypothetical protein E5CHR_05429 [Variovorax sp. PBL-E5]